MDNLYRHPNPPDPIPPHEPPITRTSRQIRNESIRIFYLTWRFPLVIHPDLRASRFDVWHAVDWYDKLSPTKLRMISHLAIHLCMKEGVKSLHQNRGDDALVFHIDLDRKKGNVAHLVQGQWMLYPEGPIDPIILHLKARLEVVLEKWSSIVAELGTEGLRNADDIYRFVPVAEDL